MGGSFAAHFYCSHSCSCIQLRPWLSLEYLSWPIPYFWGLGTDFCQKHLISPLCSIFLSTWYFIIHFVNPNFLDKQKIWGLLKTRPEMGIILTIFYWTKHGTTEAQIQGEGKLVPPLKKRNYMHIIVGDNLWK